MAQSGEAIERLPSVSVVIRSYNRIEACLELLEAVLAQDYPEFEVVVIEQSTEITAEQKARLDELGRDLRLRVIFHPPLGAARARNTGWRQAKNEIVLFMDDDDLPLHRDWIRRHAENFRDPNCIGVTGREVRSPDEDPTPFNTRRDYAKCLRYSFLKMPRGRTRHTRRIQGVTALQGGNTSIRRSVLERVGGWDELTESTDENSFDFRFDRVKRPGEYRVFDPLPAMLRRMDQGGGLARRSASVTRVLSFELAYSHRLLRRYFPGRFYSFYPAYLWLAAYRTLTYSVDHHPEQSAVSLAGTLLAAFPSALRTAWRR